MASKAFRARIWDSTEGAVEHTIASSMVSIELFGGQVVRPLQGRTESQPWQLEVLDNDDYFSSKIADSGGRMVLLRRLVDVQASENGGAYATVATGRLTDLQDHVSHYRLTIDDERVLERQSKIWTSLNADIGTTGGLGTGTTAFYAGTYLIPAGVAVATSSEDAGLYGPHSYQFYVFDNSTSAATTAGNLVRVRLSGLVYPAPNFGQSYVAPFRYMSHAAVSLIEEDVADKLSFETTSTQGNFNTLRCLIDGTNYEVQGIGLERPTRESQLMQPLRDMLAEVGGAGDPSYAWVVWTTGPSTAPGRAALWMPEHEPTPVLPLHIGRSCGIHPFALVRDVYDQIGVRYSTVMTDLIADKSYGTVLFRVTRPETAARWLEDHIYKPLGVAPLIDQDGKVGPVPIRLMGGDWLEPQYGPASSEMLTLATSELAQQPTWQYSGEDQVTRVKLVNFKEKRWREYDKNGQVGRSVANSGIDFAADLIAATEQDQTKDHDRIDEFHVFEEEYLMDGWNDMEPIGGDFPFAPMWIRLRPYATYMARETFDRFGDGPIRGRLVPVSTAKDIQPGTFFKLNVPTFPDPSTGGARGGERVVQALSVSYDPAGPHIEWLDAGPQAQAQSAPTVSLAQSASDPHHTLVATIAAVTSGGTWQLQMAKSATQPSTDSALWYISTEGSTDSLTAYVNRLASGSTHWARVRVSSPQSFRSFWSTPDSTETTDLTGPSGLASTSISAYSAGITWTAGETDYGTDVLLDQSATCPSSGLEVVAKLREGSNGYWFWGLTEDSTHCAAVRHYDEYGGVSVSTSLSIQTTTDRPSAPQPLRLELVAGSTCP